MTDETAPSAGEKRGGTDEGPQVGGRLGGERLVVGLYAILTLVTGVFGYVIGLIRPEALDPKLFFLVDLPPTPLGMAMYGMVTVATVLGAVLLLVRYVGRRFDADAR